MMPVKNKLKEVLTERLGVEKITAYRFRKMTGLGQETSLNALSNPDWYPDKKTTEALCKVFGLQPGDFLIFEEEGVEN